MVLDLLADCRRTRLCIAYAPGLCNCGKNLDTIEIKGTIDAKKGLAAF
jgi:hypothetical protein